MTGNRMVLTIEAESTEGIHDFIEVLANIQESIKGGFEKGQSGYCESGCGCDPEDGGDINNGNHPGAACVWNHGKVPYTWKITPQ